MDKPKIGHSGKVILPPASQLQRSSGNPPLQKRFARDNLPRAVTIVPMITKNLGMLLLAIYLILVGLIGIFGISLGAASIVLPILALVAGILILLGK
jgi:hypothetical protein